LCLKGDADSTGFATPTGDPETGDAEHAASDDRSVRESVALVLAKTAIEMKTSPDTIVGQLARHAIGANFGGEETDRDVFLSSPQREDGAGVVIYRLEPLNTEDESIEDGNAKTKQKVIKKPVDLTLNDNNHTVVQALRRKLKTQTDLQNDVYYWLNIDKTNPLLQEFRQAFSTAKSFDFMESSREVIVSAYTNEDAIGELMTRIQMAAAYGDPRSEECLGQADNRIAFCKKHPEALCGAEPGTGEPKWRFHRDIVSGGTEKIERAIAKSYNTNSKFAIGAEAIKARVNYSISYSMPLRAVTDAMVAVQGITHWVNTGLAEQRGAIPQGKEVGQEGEGLDGGEQGKGHGSHVKEDKKVKETGSAAGRGGG